MTLPLYITCAKIFKPSSIRKAWLIFSIQIWHPTPFVLMSTILYTKWQYHHRYCSWLLAFVTANLMQANRYQYDVVDIDIKVRQRQDKTTFMRNNVSMIMVCPNGEIISVWYQHKVKTAKYRCVRCLYRYSCWNWQSISIRYSRYRYRVQAP